MDDEEGVGVVVVVVGMAASGAASGGDGEEDGGFTGCRSWDALAVEEAAGSGEGLGTGRARMSPSVSTRGAAKKWAMACVLFVVLCGGGCWCVGVGG